MAASTAAETTEDGRTLSHHADDVETKATMWDDDLLYEVAIDPFQQTALTGKDEGRAAGLRDGYVEGVNIGRSKGWEVGLELGYIYEFSRGILDLDSSLKKSSSLHEQMQSHRWERCLTLANDLTHMIDEFPDPDSLLVGDGIERKSMKTTMNDEVNSEKQSTAQLTADSGNFCKGHYHAQSPNNGDIINHDGMQVKTLNLEKANISVDDHHAIATAAEAEAASMLDISAPLERIRARFKLLCILLKTKQSFDLKNLLDTGIGSRMDTHQHQRGITETTEDKPVGNEIESRSRGEGYKPLPVEDMSALDSDW